MPSSITVIINSDRSTVRNMKLILTILSTVGVAMVFALPARNHFGGGGGYQFSNGTGNSYNFSSPANSSAGIPRFGFKPPSGIPGFGNGQPAVGFPGFGNGQQNGGFPFNPSNGQGIGGFPNFGNNQQGGNFPFFR
uniref:Uncharacterized protein n=1 Tax=Anopheles culicifacies TaxID=139723 RepID=A0A2C9GUJ2_9DIPT